MQYNFSVHKIKLDWPRDAENFDYGGKPFRAVVSFLSKTGIGGLCVIFLYKNKLLLIFWP